MKPNTEDPKNPTNKLPSGGVSGAMPCSLPSTPDFEENNAFPEKKIRQAEELRSKLKQLKIMTRASKRATINGRHGWGDHNRNLHIRQLRREIQILKENDHGDLHPHE